MRRTRLAEIELWLEFGVLDGLRTEAARMSPKETGGVLLGYRAADGVTPVVTSWIGPGPDAQHWETGFVPDYAYQEHEIALRYAVSGRRLSYLGDWHTHPTGAPHLSATDKACLRRIARATKARVTHPVMVVLAGSPRWTVTAWQGERRGWSLLGSCSIRAIEVREGRP